MAAAQAGVSIETLRYYESAGLLPPPLPWWWSQGGVLRLGQRWSA